MVLSRTSGKNMERNTDAKKLLRKEMKSLRDALPHSQKLAWDRRIKEQLLDWPVLWKSGVVFCYASYGSEVDTLALIGALLSSGKAVACPRVAGERMLFCRIFGLEELEPGYRGILEPIDGCPIAEHENALLIVPGLAFTKKGERLGYGGGYYDRFLSAGGNYAAVGLAYPFQIIDKIPMDAYDRRVDYIMTQGRNYVSDPH